MYVQKVLVSSEFSLNRMSFLLIGVILVTIFPSSNSFHYLTPDDKELIYDWKANVRAGTYSSSGFASQFVLQGKIHLQKNNSSVFVKIANLTYKIYNGIVDQSPESEIRDIHIPEEVQELENVFEIVYNDDGLVHEIVTKRDEKEFSRNIKKAVSGIFQLDASVTGKEFSHPETFVVGENSIYGFGNVYYSIYLRNGGFEVDKIYDMTDSSYSYKNVLTNGEFEGCDGNYEEMGTHDSRKKYIIVRKHDNLLATSIRTTGTIIYHPFHINSNAQYVEIVQTFNLADTIPITEDMRPDTETITTDLTYNPYIKWQNGRDYDFTNGRHTTNYDKLIPVVKKILEEIAPHLYKSKIGIQEFGAKNGQLVNRVQTLLLQFNPEGLHLLMKSLDVETLHIFYNILPLVDSDASKLLIKDLIVSKIVSDEVAVKMIQGMGENVRPIINLLPELETLIHLEDSYDWEVRKVALLRFGTLIHKSYVYFKNNKLESPDEIYEKYVTEYVNRLISSNNYKEQQVYILGLRNMKLPSVIKHLRLAFNGEWWQDQHLRFLSLWAASAADSDDIFETLWPILTNTAEPTEMRLLAYLNIMKSQPSDSILKLIANHMLHEQNEELYHFHYTYLQSLVDSKEPCLDDMRSKVAKVMKLAPQPKYGLSSAKIFSYSDKFGFGNTFESYFFKTKRSRIYNVILKSQQFKKYQEEYSIYLKIHDNQSKHLSPTGTILDSLYYFFKNRFSKWANDGNNIEGVILRRGQIINTYYFDGSNANLAQQVLRNLIFQPTRHINMFHVNYHNYEKTVIPTDLGIPVSWEILKPALYQNRLNFTMKSKKDFAFEFLIKNRLTALLHYRHGLSFYNPINNMWQGINRYHYFNAIVPVQLKLSYSSFLNTLNFMWTKSEDMAGIRSYAKQVVFVRDEFSREQFQTLSFGRKFKNYNTIIDKEDLNTGLKLYVGVSDNRRRFSTSSFINHLYLFAQKDTKQFTSPLEHLILGGANLLSYTMLLPEPEVDAVIATLELSPKYSVSSTKLSIKYNLDLEPTIPYVPEYKANLYFSYSVKNKSETLLMWISNTSIEAERGHSFGRIKTELTRLVPGEGIYKMCANASEKFLKDKVYSHLHVSLGEGGREKCPHGSSVDVYEIGAPTYGNDVMSDPQSSCQNQLLPWQNYHTLQCLVSQNMIRYYRYEVKTNNLPKWSKDLAATLWDNFKSFYQSHYTVKNLDNSNTDIELQADVIFPTEAPDEVDIKLRTPQNIYQLSAIPNNYWRIYGFFPKMTSYSMLYLLYEKSSFNDRLVIFPDRYYFNNEMMRQNVPTKWTPYLKSATKTDVYVKLGKNSTLAVKINSNHHTFKILPRNGSYQISKNGKLVSLEEQHMQDWLYYHVFKEEFGQPLIVFLPISGIHLEYYLHRVTFTVPDSSQYISLS